MIAFQHPYHLVIAVLGALGAVIGWLWVLRRDRAIRHIHSPTLGVLNLIGTAGRAWASDDVAALAPHFNEVRESREEPPRCDVLFVYCDIGPEGRITHSERGLRELIRDSKAQIAVVASPNAPADCLDAARETGIGSANLVLTLDRKGAAFARFFDQLFARMNAGSAMPGAWTELQPQSPTSLRPDNPDLVCLMERGAIAFRRADQESATKRAA